MSVRGTASRILWIGDVPDDIANAGAPERRIGGEAATLERIAGLETAPLGLVGETLAAPLEGRPTLGAEWHCLRGTLANRLLDRHWTESFDASQLGRLRTFLADDEDQVG